MLLKPAIQSAGFHPVGGGGEASPPKRKRERRKEEKERKRERETEKEREREVHGVGRGVCTFLRCIASDQYSLLLHASII